MRSTLLLLLICIACDATERPVRHDSAEPCPEDTTCRRWQFDAARATCVSEPTADGARCDAPCMDGAICSNGNCIGTQRSCDDGDVCTVDLCAGDRCTHVVDPVQTCGTPSDPCLVPVCDGACGVAPAPDGTVCGSVSCSMRQICRAGVCTNQEVENGEPCDGPCATGRCEGGFCVGGDELRLAWEISSEPRLDPLTGRILFYDAGSSEIVDVSRDGTRRAIAAVEGASWANGGIGGGQIVLPHVQSSLITGIPIDGSGGAWSIDPAGASHRQVEDVVVLGDGRTVLGHADGSATALDSTGVPVAMVSICSGARLVSLAADESERIFAAVDCYDEGRGLQVRVAELTRAGALVGTVDVYTPHDQSVAYLKIFAASDAHVLVFVHEGADSREWLVDMDRGTAVELDDGTWGRFAAMTPGLLLVHDDGVLRALDPDSVEELWALDGAKLARACGRVPCTGGGWDGRWVFLTAEETLLATGDFGRRALLEIADGGTVRRSCTISDPEKLGGPVRILLMDGLLVAETADYRWAAWELPWRPVLAWGWFGGAGGPAGGKRAHVPSR